MKLLIPKIKNQCRQTSSAVRIAGLILASTFWQLCFQVVSWIYVMERQSNTLYSKCKYVFFCWGRHRYLYTHTYLDIWIYIYIYITYQVYIVGQCSLPCLIHYRQASWLSWPVVLGHGPKAHNTHGDYPEVHRLGSNNVKHICPLVKIKGPIWFIIYLLNG